MQRPKLSPASWFRRLDFLPPWAAWALGLASGALAGAALAGAAPGALGVIGFLGLLGAAAGLAASGEPIAVVEGVETPGEPSREQATAPPLEQTMTDLLDDTLEIPLAQVTTHTLVDLVEIPGGSFLMGSLESEVGRFDNEGVVHIVSLSPFACMRVPVTRRLYAEVVGQDPSYPFGNSDDRPVNTVSWRDAITFCNRLSEREGLDSCYQIEGEQVSWNREASGYRLLTEAEWEYACRAGTSSRWSFGDDEKRLGDYAWFEGNSADEPQPVGGKLPNAWGLHGMHGSVWEWCWDWLGDYSPKPRRDPAGPAEGTERIARGGAFDSSPRYLRSAVRVRFLPAVRARGIGFRCARSLRRQP